MDRWLLCENGPAPAARNMALDEALLRRAEERGGPPVLRLYSFDPPAITLGAHQNPDEALDLAAVRAAGIEVARRVTGGRALLHAGELTYCVAAPLDGVFGGPAPDAFALISGALASALRALGVAAEVARGREAARPRGAAPPCLSSTTRAELAVRGRKIAGSAQRRTARALLQHGSILLRPGSERIVEYLKGAPVSLADRVTNVEAELGGPVAETAVRAAIADAFARAFHIIWEPLRLDARELAPASAGESGSGGRRACRGAGEVAAP